MESRDGIMPVYDNIHMGNNVLMEWYLGVGQYPYVMVSKSGIMVV